MKHDFENGKYTLEFNELTGELKALRYGEPWQDFSGNKLIYLMLAEIDALKAVKDEVNNWIVCAAITTPEYMMQNAQRIEEITRTA